MILVVCIVISIFVAWFVLKPYLYNQAAYLPLELAEDVIVLQDQKDRYINMLRDLELDYSTGKVSQDDYEKMKLDLSHDLSKLISK